DARRAPGPAGRDPAARRVHPADSSRWVNGRSCADSGSGQKVGDQDPGRGRGEGRHRFLRAQAPNSRIDSRSTGPRTARSAMDLENLLDEVDDPVVADAPTRVEARLEDSIGAQAVVGNLDYQGRTRRVLARIVPRRALDDSDIGLGLRVGV